jgi:hypothetical protein
LGSSKYALEMALALNLLTYKTGRYYFTIKVTSNLPLGYKKLAR